MKRFAFLVLYFLATFFISAQPLLHIDGVITIAASSESAPVAGTIRWTGSDFEGYNGYAWTSLTSRKF